MPEFDAVLLAAAQLPVADRLRLIDELAASVPDDQPPALSAEWIEEIERRAAEIEAGTVRAIPWESVRADLFPRAGLEHED